MSYLHVVLACCWRQLALRVKSLAFMMIMAIGLEAIGQGVGAQDRAAWQVQVGVTRVGAGGRVLPRCRNGRMTTPDGLVVSTTEPQTIGPQQFVRLPRPARKPAPLARTVAFLTVAVVVAPAARVPRSFLTLACTIWRSIWSALVPHRRAVSDRAKQAWQSAREMGIALSDPWINVGAT